MCLEKQPGARYLTGFDLAADLRRLEITSGSRRVGAALDRGTRFWGAAWAALGVALVTIVLLDSTSAARASGCSTSC